jgi:hypothetical protein
MLFTHNIVAMKLSFTCPLCYLTTRRTHNRQDNKSIYRAPQHTYMNVMSYHSLIGSLFWILSLFCGIVVVVGCNQLERKRHLGNDVCVIIFKDSEDEENRSGDTPLTAAGDTSPLFAPDTIKSEFNRILIALLFFPSQFCGPTHFTPQYSVLCCLFLTELLAPQLLGSCCF